MVVLEQITTIAAPMQRVFDLSRSIDVERGLIESWGGSVAGGRTAGLICEGETVTWRLWQFGIHIRHRTCIRGMTSPPEFADWYFQDAMEAGIFQRFWHDHYFTAMGNGQVRLRDEIHFAVPWYLLGSIAERGWVRRRLTDLLSTRNATIRRLAESDEWREYLPAESLRSEKT